MLAKYHEMLLKDHELPPFVERRARAIKPSLVSDEERREFDATAAKLGEDLRDPVAEARRRARETHVAKWESVAAGIAEIGARMRAVTVPVPKGE